MTVFNRKQNSLSTVSIERSMCVDVVLPSKVLDEVNVPVFAVKYAPCITRRDHHQHADSNFKPE